MPKPVLIDSQNGTGFEFVTSALGRYMESFQSVTNQLLGMISQRQIFSIGEPTSVSTTVFCHSVGEAFLCAARAEFEPASVTTVASQPQWTLDTLFNVYREITDTSFRVVYAAKPGSVLMTGSSPG
ncbi:MAG: hypothetical protein R3C49_23735 [Planctomycetaceae bacterium]